MNNTIDFTAQQNIMNYFCIASLVIYFILGTIMPLIRYLLKLDHQLYLYSICITSLPFGLLLTTLFAIYSSTHTISYTHILFTLSPMLIYSISLIIGYLIVIAIEGDILEDNDNS